MATVAAAPVAPVAPVAAVTAEPYSYDAKSNAILFSSFFLLFVTGATGMRGSVEKKSNLFLSLAFFLGLGMGWVSSDYPMGEESDGGKHTRGALMMTTFGLIPALLQVYLLVTDKSTVNKNTSVMLPNLYLMPLAMGGLLGHSMARLSVDLQEKEGHEIHLGWYATTVSLVGVSFLLAVFKAFNAKDTISRIRHRDNSSGSGDLARYGGMGKIDDVDLVGGF